MVAVAGLEAFNDCTERLSRVGELKRDEGAQEEITELKSLMRGHQLENTSSGSLIISGSSTGGYRKS